MTSYGTLSLSQLNVYDNDNTTISGNITYNNDNDIIVMNKGLDLDGNLNFVNTNGGTITTTDNTNLVIDTTTIIMNKGGLDMSNLDNPIGNSNGIIIFGDGTRQTTAYTGGSGGDVTKGGDNTFTGTNEFTSNFTVDNSLTNIGQLDNDNTAIGDKALYSLTTSGTDNTAIGKDALGSLTTGTNNVAIGKKSNFNLTGGSYNIAIGHNTGVESNNQSLSNTIAIGNSITSVASGDMIFGFSQYSNSSDYWAKFTPNTQTTNGIILQGTYNGSNNFTIDSPNTFLSGNLDIIGNITMNNNDSSGNLSYNTNNSDGNFYMNKGLDVSGNIDLSGNLTINGETNINGIIFPDGSIQYVAYTGSGDEVTTGGDNTFTGTNTFTAGVDICGNLILINDDNDSSGILSFTGDINNNYFAMDKGLELGNTLNIKNGDLLIGGGKLSYNNGSFATDNGLQIGGNLNITSGNLLINDATLSFNGTKFIMSNSLDLYNENSGTIYMNGNYGINMRFPSGNVGNLTFNNTNFAMDKGLDLIGDLNVNNINMKLGGIFSMAGNEGAFISFTFNQDNSLGNTFLYNNAIRIDYNATSAPYGLLINGPNTLNDTGYGNLSYDTKGDGNFYMNHGVDLNGNLKLFNGDNNAILSIDGNNFFKMDKSLTLFDSKGAIYLDGESGINMKIPDSYGNYGIGNLKFYNNYFTMDKGLQIDNSILIRNGSLAIGDGILSCDIVSDNNFAMNKGLNINGDNGLSLYNSVKTTRGYLNATSLNLGVGTSNGVEGLTNNTGVISYIIRVTGGIRPVATFKFSYGGGAIICVNTLETLSNYNAIWGASASGSSTNGKVNTNITSTSGGVNLEYSFDTYTFTITSISNPTSGGEILVTFIGSLPDNVDGMSQI